MATLAAPSGSLRKRQPMVAILASDQHHAENLARQFGLGRDGIGEHLIILRPRQSATGRRYSAILVTCDYREMVYYASDTERRENERWYTEALMTSLAPGARIIDL